VGSKDKVDDYKIVMKIKRKFKLIEVKVHTKTKKLSTIIRNLLIRRYVIRYLDPF
jgi:hypothetical protein